MSETNKGFNNDLKDKIEAPQITPRQITPTRFFLYVAGTSIAFILILFALGTTLTHFLWPPQDKLSHPVSTPEQ